jgi:hypothetical protein
MPFSQFTNPRLLPTGELEVGGPFDLEFDLAQLQGEVTIRFLIIQPVQGEQPVVIDEVTSWTVADGQTWLKTVPASRVDQRLKASPALGTDEKKGKCRGVAQAIVIRNVPPATPGDPADPPIFDSFTWCVTTEVLRA